MAMADNKNNAKQYFVRCAESYRFFLKKFSEKPIFNYESIGLGLAHVYDKLYNRRGPVPWKSKVRLVNTIMLNEQKVLKDLDTLKRHPESAVTPLAASNVSLGKVTKLVTEILDGCDDFLLYDDKELFNKVCKKFRCCSSSKNAKIIIKNLKEKYIQGKKRNGQILPKLKSPIKNRKILSMRRNRRVPNPIVLLEKDVHLQCAAKNADIPEIKQEENENEESKDERCNQNCNGNLVEEVHTNLSEKEVEQNNIVQNEGLPYSSILSFIKQEKDLTDNDQATPEVAQTENESTENDSNNDSSSETEIISQSSQGTQTFSVQSTPSNDQENMLRTENNNNNNNNNVIPSMQFMNNVRFIPNSVLMLNGSCNAYAVLPMAQFQPNIIMINPNDMNVYSQAMFNNLMQFNNSPLQNSMSAASNFSTMPAQQLNFNQGLNQSQDIARIQTMIENLNSQVNSLGYILANQMHRNA